MKSFIGGCLVVVGALFGLYAGLWWALVGGIVDVVTAVKMDDVPAMDLAFGVLKILAASFIGFVSAMVLVLPGLVMMEVDLRSK